MFIAMAPLERIKHQERVIALDGAVSKVRPRTCKHFVPTGLKPEQLDQPSRTKP